MKIPTLETHEGSATRQVKAVSKGAPPATSIGVLGRPLVRNAGRGQTGDRSTASRNMMRVVLTGRWARGRRTKSPISSRLAANLLGTKLPKTHSPRDTEKEDRSLDAKSYSGLCGFRGAGQFPAEVQVLAN